MVLPEGAVKEAGVELSSNVHSTVNPARYTTSWLVKKQLLGKYWQASHELTNCFL